MSILVAWASDVIRVTGERESRVRTAKVVDILMGIVRTKNKKVKGQNDNE